MRVSFGVWNCFSSPRSVVDAFLFFDINIGVRSIGTHFIFVHVIATITTATITLGWSPGCCRWYQFERLFLDTVLFYSIVVCSKVVVVGYHQSSVIPIFSVRMDREGSIAGSPQHGTPSSISSAAAAAVAEVVVCLVILVTTTGGNGTAMDA